MRGSVLAVVVGSELIGSRCAFGATEGTNCRITDIGADARYDVNGNQVDIYDVKFFDGCQNAHVRASYNVGTQEAQETLERPRMQATAS